jgi:hypothetical protein
VRRNDARQCAHERAKRADDGINARCERQDAGEPWFAKGGCNNVHVRFAAQRPQCRGKGG